MESPQQFLIDLPNGMRVHRHGDTSVIIKEIWQEKSYQNLRDVKPGDVVFDIGANQGIFSLYAASKGAKVFSVEPDPANFDVLQKNIELNNLMGQVIPIHCAVASQSGFITLYIPERDGQPLTGLITTTKSVSQQYSHMDITAMRECQVKSSRFSELIQQYDISQIDLLKIDCEGAELDILGSGDEKDFKVVKHLVMETHAGYSEADLYRKIQSLGFHVVSYQQISGIYATGYVWAESLQEAKESTYSKPVAIAELSEQRVLGEVIVVDASKSFGTQLQGANLTLQCLLNGKQMKSIGSQQFSAVIEQKNLNNVSLIATQGGESSVSELHFWAFESNYGADLSSPNNSELLALSIDKLIFLKGKQGFCLTESEMPKAWESRYFYLSVNIHDWHLQGCPEVHFHFNGDDYLMSEQQKTFEFPFFPITSDFCFALESERDLVVTLRCFSLEQERPKESEDIDLGKSDSFVLPKQGQKYVCHAVAESKFEFEFFYKGWVPNRVKFGLGVTNDQNNGGELTGQLKVGDSAQVLNGWYRELVFEPPFNSSKITVELSVPSPRNYVVAWWPE